jgi:hypothetical protein
MTWQDQNTNYDLAQSLSLKMIASAYFPIMWGVGYDICALAGTVFEI